MDQGRRNIVIPPLLSGAAGCVAAWHAGHLPGPYLTSDGKLRDIVSNLHHGQFGSTSGADSNDPLALTPTDGQVSIYMPVGTGNSLQVNDFAALGITGDIDIRVACALSDWTPASPGRFVQKFGSAGDRSYIFQLDGSGTGTLGWTWSADGTASVAKSSTVAPTVADGALLLVRVTHDVDNGASGNDVKFYTKAPTGWVSVYSELASNTGWSQLGSTVTTAGVTSIFDSAAQFFVSPGASGLDGRFAGCVVCNGIGGTIVQGSDFTRAPYYNATRTSITSVVGGAVQINRATSGRKPAVVDRPMILFGNDDYIEVANNAAIEFGTKPFTVAIALRRYGTPTHTLIAKRAGISSSPGSNPGWGLVQLSAETGPRFRITDGTTLADGLGTGVSDGVAQVVTGVRGVTGNRAAVNGTVGSAVTGGATLDLTIAQPLRIGTHASGGNYGEFEFFAAALFDRALSNNEIRRLNATLMGEPA